MPDVRLSGADPRSHHLQPQCQPSLPWVGQSSAQPGDALGDALRDEGLSAGQRSCSQAQPRVGKVSAGLGAAGVLPQDSSIPNSPACSWLPACLETRKLTESSTRVMRHPQSFAGQQSSQQHCSKYFTTTAFTMEKSPESWKFTL